MTHQDDDLDRTERDIGATREAIEERLAALEERLLSKEAMQDALGYARRIGSSGRDVAEGLAQTARENPIPTALLGIGLGWLAYELLRDRPDHSTYYDPYEDAGPYQDVGIGPQEEGHGRFGRTKERVRHAGEYVGERAQQYAHRAGDAVRHSGESADRFVRRHPLATGATVFAVGVAVGALVTSSAEDRRALRRRMDETARTARHRFREEAERARSVAESAAKAARDEVLRKTKESPSGTSAGAGTTDTGTTGTGTTGTGATGTGTTGAGTTGTGTTGTGTVGGGTKPGDIGATTSTIGGAAAGPKSVT